jgi:hypothetical protein
LVDNFDWLNTFGAKNRYFMETTPIKVPYTRDDASEENKGDNTPLTPSLKSRVLKLGTVLQATTATLEKREKEIIQAKKDREVYKAESKQLLSDIEKTKTENSEIIKAKDLEIREMSQINK